MGQKRWLVGLLAALSGCSLYEVAPGALRMASFPPQLSGEEVARKDPAAKVETTKAETASVCSPSLERPTPIAAGSRLELGPRERSLALSPGRYAVRVHVPPSRLVSLAVSGPSRALRGFEVVGRGRLARLQTELVDGELPAFVTFASTSDAEPLLVVIDSESPVTLHRAEFPFFEEPASARADASTLLPLVGMPTPTSKKAGYRLAVAPRYAFLRADASEALRAAFREARSRFGREPIAVGDATQWNGERPANDRLLPRHISHHEGRDVDLGLPGTDGDSSMRHRCKLDLAQPERVTCVAGSVTGLDAHRLAFLFARLLEGPSPRTKRSRGPKSQARPLAPLELIFADAAYIEAVRAVLPVLARRRWILPETLERLADDRLLRASPWHTDHVHVRFAGHAAAVAEPLRSIPSLP